MMADRVVQAIYLLILLYLAANHWHIYIREKQYEKNGWLALMAALAATIAATYIWFN